MAATVNYQFADHFALLAKRVQELQKEITEPVKRRKRAAGARVSVLDIPTSIEQMKNVVEGSEVSEALAQLSRVERKLRSRKKMAKAEQYSLAGVVGSVKNTIIYGVNKISKGIASLLQAIKNGDLLPVTQGYKALKENFDELMKEISQVSVLQEVSSKCYSKGLITLAEKKACFEGGIDIMTRTNNFLDLICSRVKRNKKAYDTFLTILRSEPAYENLVMLAGGAGGGGG